MENSLIASFLIGIASRIKEQYQHSYLKLFIDRIYSSLILSKERSVILSALSGESKLGSKWKESNFYRIAAVPVNALRKLLSRFWSIVEVHIKNSRILTVTDNMLSNMFNYSIRSYGALVFALLAVEAVLWVTLQGYDLRNLAIRGFLLAVSMGMMLLDIPMAALLKGSFAYAFVENAFVDSFKPYDENKAVKAAGLPVLLLAGAILGIIAYVLPVKLVIMGAVAALAAIIILWRYEAGVFLSAGFAALLPTTALYLLMILTILSFVIRWAAGRLPKYKATPIDALLIMFFIVLSYSTLTSYFRMDSINVLFIHTLMLTFFFVVTRTINTKYQLYLLVGLLTISATLTSLYGIYQYYGGAASTAAWVDTTMFQDIQSRVGATFNNPNILGEYLIMMIPLALALLWYRKKVIYKGIFLAMLGIMGLCMLYTFSRGAWLGLIFAMVGFCVVRDKRLFALFLIALFIMPFVLPPSVINRFTSIGNMQDTSSSYRMSILLGSLRMAQSYWLTGIGLGSEAFKAIYPKYSLAAAYAHHSHNIYIQVILETGIAGALVFMLILLVFARATLAHQGKTKDRFLSSVMIAACMGVAGYMVQGLVENIWYNYRVLQIFWVVMAVGLCALRLAKEEVQEND